MASVSALLGGGSPETRRRLPLQRKHRMAPAFSTAALLISLAAMGLVMWFIGIVGPQVQQLRGYLSHSAPAARGPAATASSAEEPAGADGYPASGESGNESATAAVSRSGTSSSATTVRPIADLSTTVPMPLRSHGFECLSDTCDTAGGVVYPNAINVTKWRRNEDLDAPCPVVRDNSAELLIKEDGHYLLYSQAQLLGSMNEGIVLRNFSGENRRRSLRIQHRIVCWRNCIGARDRSSGAVILRSAEVTVLDVLNTYVAVQVRLRSGSTVGVMVTSLNVLGDRYRASQEFVLGVVRLS